MQWIKELNIERGGLRAKATGQLITLNWGNVTAIVRGIFAHFLMQMLRLISQFTPGRSYRIAFIPSRPAPWYLLWAIIHAGKGQITKDINKADALCFFEDATHVTNEIPNPGAPIRTINAQCTDISKSTVERVFAEVFGYSLAIDPTTHQGPAAEKSEENGAHDGCIVLCPTTPKPGRVYEKLLVNSDNGATVIDYRSPSINGEIPLVFVKERPIATRFSNSNSNVSLADPKTLFSPDELRLLAIFCKKMRLDFGGLDVLRNREDGRIYVVDVNKTDMGPPTALPFWAQIRSARILAKAFRNYIVLGPRG